MVGGHGQAAAEFRAHQRRCEAAVEATRGARRAEAEQRQAARRQLAAKMEEEARCEALLRRERQLEREKEESVAAVQLSSMLGLDALRQ